jgi:C-terminal processing protease CtpA/Prc
MDRRHDRRRLPGALAAAGALGLVLCGAACRSAPPENAPPLATMEEPLALRAEPDDEARRTELDPGAFSGVLVIDGRRSLEALLGEPEGVLVERVVENSPGAAAGLEPGDLLFELETPAGARELHWPSDWRAAELAGQPGESWSVGLDRAGRELRAELSLVARVAPAAREEAPRVREEERVGVVLRGATEVEARAAGLAPGAGAVVVGLSLDSPWRAGGLVFGDLITHVDGAALAHPQQLVEQVRAAEADARLALDVRRGEETFALALPLSRRARETTHVHIPLILHYEREREASTTSMLLGLVRVRRTSAAWDARILWLFSFGRGDADRLVEVEG